jgi:hypothetical protein
MIVIVATGFSLEKAGLSDARQAFGAKFFKLIPNFLRY